MEQSGPTVSVVIVTYQHAKFIMQCLDSILMQKTDFAFEIILGDDESTDGTREICIDYANRYPDIIRLFLRSKEDRIFINGAPTGRFNFMEGLKDANGKYIALCEGDDYWTDPYKLQKQVNFLENNRDYSGCFHFTQQINEDGRLDKIYGKHGNMVDFGIKDTFSITTLFHTSSFMFLRSALQFPEWYTIVTSADMALFSIVTEKGKLKCLPEIMSVYRKHEGGITKTSGVVNNYHVKRIELMNFLNEFHGFKYKKKAEEVIMFHRRSMNEEGVKISLWSRLKQKFKNITN